MLIRLRLAAIVLAAMPLIGACAADLNLTPWPRQLTREAGGFRLTSATPIVCTKTNDAPCAFAADFLAGLIRRTRNLPLSRVANADGPAIVLRRTSTPVGEGYRLAVRPWGIEITAADDAGLLYGAMTLYQLATPEADPVREIAIPAVTIDDAPRFGWRGLMLDSARHFQSPDEIKRFLDVMAWHKLNVLHWHLVDDQGWRIEIKRYPRLTKIGAFRHNRREGRYGGYYTQAQIRDIVAYAKARAITIVPELEMPGHALAAISAYPRLGSTRRVPNGPSGDWGIFPYLYNVDDSTFAFIDNVLTEVMALFPSPYIHVGGDEAPKGQWNTSAAVQRRMHALGVADTKALQGYFTHRIGTFLAAHGRRLIGWDEILEGQPPANAVVMSWRTVESAGEAADRGHDVVLSPAPVLYFDYCQAARAGEPTCRGPQSSLADVYTFAPTPQGALEHHLLGVQANIWTEHMPTAAGVFYAAFPRAAALAETGWSAGHDWQSFLMRLPAEFERYRVLAIPASQSAFAVAVTAVPAGRDVRIALANQVEAGVIHYRTDGGVPDEASPVYNGPFKASHAQTIAAATYLDGHRLGGVTFQALGAAAILRRTSWAMDQCTNDLPLAQRSGTVVSMVNVMNPCWIYRGLDLAPIRGLDVSLGPLPFNFQIGNDVKKIPLYPTAARGGALEIRADSCTGPLLASLKLPRVRRFTTLHADLPPQTGVHDVCLNFARRKVDPVWAIDWVQPLLKE